MKNGIIVVLSKLSLFFITDTMTTKKKILQEIESLPKKDLDKLMDFLQQIKKRKITRA